MGRLSKVFEKKTGTKKEQTTGGFDDTLEIPDIGPMVADSETDVASPVIPQPGAAAGSSTPSDGGGGYGEYFRPHRAVADTSRWDNRLVAYKASSSEVAESFRRLRTAIVHPLERAPSRSVLVASYLADEGKSFTTANLAISIAQGLEQYALLVDCNLRKPSLARMFGLSNDRGLVNYLQDGADLQNLMVPSGLDKLTLLPAGPPPGNPSELLGSSKMEELLQEVVSRYNDRFIILDAPPMQLASEINVLANHCSGAVLVVRWGGAKRQQIRRLVDVIGKKKLLGVLFNAVYSDMLEEKLRNVLRI